MGGLVGGVLQVYERKARARTHQPPASANADWYASETFTESRPFNDIVTSALKKLLRQCYLVVRCRGTAEGVTRGPSPVSGGSQTPRWRGSDEGCADH